MWQSEPESSWSSCPESATMIKFDDSYDDINNKEPLGCRERLMDSGEKQAEVTRGNRKRSSLW